jgi:hypothetical protein
MRDSAWGIAWRTASNWGAMEIAFTRGAMAFSTTSTG